MLTSLSLALSLSLFRPRRVFVQHKLMQNADRIWHLIHHEDANLYVCGYGIFPLSLV